MTTAERAFREAAMALARAVKAEAWDNLHRLADTVLAAEGAEESHCGYCGHHKARHSMTGCHATVSLAPGFSEGCACTYADGNAPR